MLTAFFAKRLLLLASLTVPVLGCQPSEPETPTYRFVKTWGQRGDGPGELREPIGIVISGEIWLELDDGEVHLKPGDCVVQRGSMHAWRNRSDKPCVMSFVLIEAGSKENG